MSLTRPGVDAVGLPDDFIMGRHYIPPEPGPDERGRDLPAWVMQILDANLHVLERRRSSSSRTPCEASAIAAVPAARPHEPSRRTQAR